MNLISCFDSIRFWNPYPISRFISTSSLFTLIEASFSFSRIFNSYFIFTTNHTKLFRIFTIFIEVRIRIKTFITVFIFICSRLFWITLFNISKFRSSHSFLSHFESHLLNIIKSISFSFIVHFFH